LLVNLLLSMMVGRTMNIIFVSVPWSYNWTSAANYTPMCGGGKLTLDIILPLQVFRHNLGLTSSMVMCSGELTKISRPLLLMTSKHLVKISVSS
jgi:hypothetical protein